LWHGPWKTPTGYWTEAEIFVKRLAAMGHEVAISCLAGLSGHKETWHFEHDGKRYSVPVYPHTAYEMTGQDVVRGHYEDFKADLIITLTCTWVLNPSAWRDMRVIHITPVDIKGMSARDYSVIADSGGTPAAVCRWGEEQMRARGLDPLYLPHGIETSLFRPPENRKALRRAMGIDHLFVAGINAGNTDPVRKSWYEQYAAFAEFHAAHPQSLLMVHGVQYLPGGVELPAIADEVGLKDCILYSNPYQMVTGQTTPEALAAWYGACDVYMQASRGEGFGLTAVEAQACGTPVISMGWATGPELTGAGWLADGQKSWNEVHKKAWFTPFIHSIAGKLELAHEQAAGLRGQAREFAMTWDADKVFAEHWAPVLADLG
jgi:glycosyltransferase involved in cell wall biosynthesis